MDWVSQIGARLEPSTPGLPAYGIAAALVAATLVVVVQPIWAQVRLVVTLVHELGHGLVGVLVGRRFTGFVVGGDGSGHAVTVGRPRGPGQIVTTWAGYPMPAMIGAALIEAGLSGWGAPALAAASVILLVVLIRVRSVRTFAVLVAVAGLVGWLWWSGSAGAQGYVLVAAGALLLVGAWRHLYAVARGGRGIDDHRALRQLTGVPAGAWVFSWIVVLALATWWAGTGLLGTLQAS